MTVKHIKGHMGGVHLVNSVNLSTKPVVDAQAPNVILRLRVRVTVTVELRCGHHRPKHEFTSTLKTMNNA